MYVGSVLRSMFTMLQATAGATERATERDDSRRAQSLGRLVWGGASVGGAGPVMYPSSMPGTGVEDAGCS